MKVDDLIKLLEKYKGFELKFIEPMGLYDYTKFKLFDVGYSSKFIIIELKEGTK